MQVKTLIEALQKMDPEAHVCALVYEKCQFDYDEDDEVELTNEVWESICNSFDESPFNEVWDSILDAAASEAVPRYL